MTDYESLHPTRMEPVVFEEQGDGVHVVIAVSVGKVLLTNTLGRRILDLCDGSRGVTAMAEIIAADHPQVSREQIQADLRKCLDMATAKGVITWM